MIEVGAWMGPSEEELKVELLLEEGNEEDEEVLFIFGKMEKEQK